jgi:RNA polymerase sigma-70 factor, ECF subfamily
MADREQFLEAFLSYESDLRALIMALVRNRQDSEDVFQETALTLWQKYDQYDPQRPFGAWARGVAAKKVLQCRTKSGRAPTPFSPETIRAIIDAIDRHESHRPQWPAALDALEKCAETLPDRSRQILTLRYREGWSIGQIAQRLASTPAAVTMAFSRIRTHLYECVKRHLGRSKEQAK